MRGKRKFDPVRAFLIGLPLAVMLFWTLGPIYWILVTAFTTNDKLYSPVLNLFPNPITLSQFRELFWDSPFLRQLRNSFYVSTITTVVSAVVGCMAAYAITRLRFKGRQLIARFLIWSYLVPASVLFIPLFSVVQRIGLVGNTNSLLLAYLTFTVPFCTWLLIGFFKALPDELEEAALIDGAGRVTAFWRVLLPLAAPGLVASAIFAFTLSWNEFLYALVFIQDEQAITVPVGLNLLIYGDVFHWGQLMAASVITTLPVVALYVFIHRWMVEGLVAGSVKG